MLPGKGIRSFVFLAVSLLILTACANVHAEKRYKKVKGGVGTLLELSRSRKEMKEVYEEEKESFEDVMEAYNEGRLKAGTSSEEVVKEYGRPVVIIEAETPGQTLWIYKSSDADFFNGEKMNLFFDGKGKLVRSEHVEAAKKQNPDKE